jgi:hypothetical protein
MCCLQCIMYYVTPTTVTGLKQVALFKIFNGTLGEWNTGPVHLKLKEGAKPLHGRPFPVPKIHKNTLIKD